jgi:radical SAM/Cys-rich protein
VIDRCNLTVLLRPGQEDTASFLAANDVHVIASLPCYLKENVEKQRGGGVFEASIEALRLLNALGYGEPGSRRLLDLVYNPVGPSLPPAQTEIERRYHEELGSRFGIRFNRILTITNMPIKRFADDLARQGRHEEDLVATPAPLSEPRSRRRPTASAARRGPARAAAERSAPLDGRSPVHYFLS